MRRWACSMKMTAAIITSPMTMTVMKVPQPLSSFTLHSDCGKVATTWVKIRIDIPLPMPCSVTSSPSHMITAVPAVIVITMTMKVAVLLLCSRSWEQPWSS